MRPRYRSLYASGELADRVRELKKQYRTCTLCPHQCGIDRTSGQFGRCRSGHLPVVASYTVHHGEEPPISGIHGSGTIFFTGCTGSCIYCQNYPISQLGTGTVVSESRLAGMMLSLQERGCHNINFVTPTHFVPSIVEALAGAIKRGLSVPLVYNTSGYERIETLRMLDGIIDIYLPDIKYSDDTIARELSGFHEYTRHNRDAIREMHRQVGDLRTYRGRATRGVIIRHLILPGGLAGTEESLQFLAREVSPHIRISLMEQYFPAYKALTHEVLSQRITDDEYTDAVHAVSRIGLKNGWVQYRR
ncbi:radical SAM protein [Candidatus Latescibacterota bacterium]